MSLYWWVDHVSTAASIPLALTGFGVAYWQLRKTRKASEAARDAAESARDAMKRHQIQLLVPQLQRVEEELDRAVRSGSLEAAATWLLSWKWQAGQLRSLTGSVMNADARFQRALQSSIAAAGRAKVELMDPSGVDLQLVTKKARVTISQVTEHMGDLAVSSVVVVEENSQDE